jgi:hypothetical protein
MADTHPDPHLVSLYRRARVCETFSAYRLDELTHVNGVEILKALELLGIAREVAQAAG